MTEDERQLAALAKLTERKAAAEAAWHEAVIKARRRGIPLRAISAVAGISPEHVRRLYERPKAVDTPADRAARRRPAKTGRG